MASVQRRIARGMLFKNMNAKQKKLRRQERKDKGGVKNANNVRVDG